MCGIIGYVGQRPARDLLLAGLQALEYRGYDSAGLSLLHAGELQTVRAVGNLQQLRDTCERISAGTAVATAAAPATIGIGHTRWATHGRVTEENAHPHSDTADSVHVVVNGIVENYLTLRERLGAEGAVFSSETDAEVISHLVAHHYDGDLVAAVRATVGELEGHFAFVVLHRDDPDRLVGTRRECPLVTGHGDGEAFVASSVSAFVAQTREVRLIEDGEIAVITQDGVELLDAEDRLVERPAVRIDADAASVEKDGYETFMLKEIHEQADAVAATLSGRVTERGVDLGMGFDDDLLLYAKRIVIVACGTSYHAGLVGRYAIEHWARVPVELDVASEFRYRDPVLGPGDLVIAITQSGETADTLAAMRLARSKRAKVLAVTNVAGSQATRECDALLLTHAGMEIGVAATKTFVCQVAVMYVVALRLAQMRMTLPNDEVSRLAAELLRVPSLIAGLVERLTGPKGTMTEIAHRHFHEDFFLYLGRHVGLPVALEGALKLKEVSYIATDAYAAGEMKHGPIALLTEDTPVVAIATDSPVRDKVVSNMQEVRARGAHVIAVATDGDLEIGEHAGEVIRVPPTDWMLQPLLAVIPLQLLAYHVARARGLNIDQPRNLAKTVTVE